jgi:hypothetical protein
MGWLAGLAGKYSDKDYKKLNSLVSTSRFSFKSNNLFISTGGISETCLFSQTEFKESGWIVSGLGIHYDNGFASFMKNED